MYRISAYLIVMTSLLLFSCARQGAEVQQVGPAAEIARLAPKEASKLVKLYNRAKKKDLSPRLLHEEIADAGLVKVYAADFTGDSLCDIARLDLHQDGILYIQLLWQPGLVFCDTVRYFSDVQNWPVATAKGNEMEFGSDLGASGYFRFAVDVRRPVDSDPRALILLPCDWWSGGQAEGQSLVLVWWDAKGEKFRLSEKSSIGELLQSWQPDLEVGTVKFLAGPSFIPRANYVYMRKWYKWSWASGRLVPNIRDHQEEYNDLTRELTALLDQAEREGTPEDVQELRTAIRKVEAWTKQRFDEKDQY